MGEAREVPRGRPSLIALWLAIALLIPPAAFFAVMLLTATMLVLLVAATVIGWARRHEVRNLFVLPR